MEKQRQERRFAVGQSAIQGLWSYCQPVWSRGYGPVGHFCHWLVPRIPMFTSDSSQVVPGGNQNSLRVPWAVTSVVPCHRQSPAIACSDGTGCGSGLPLGFCTREMGTRTICNIRPVLWAKNTVSS